MLDVMLFCGDDNEILSRVHLAERHLIYVEWHAELHGNDTFIDDLIWYASWPKIHNNLPGRAIDCVWIYFSTLSIHDTRSFRSRSYIFICLRQREFFSLVSLH